MAESSSRWSHSLLRCAGQPARAMEFSNPSSAVLASGTVSPQPKRLCALGTHAAPAPTLDASAPYLSSLSFLTRTVLTRGKSRMR